MSQPLPVNRVLVRKRGTGQQTQKQAPIPCHTAPISIPHLSLAYPAPTFSPGPSTLPLSSPTLHQSHTASRNCPQCLLSAPCLGTAWGWGAGTPWHSALPATPAHHASGSGSHTSSVNHPLLAPPQGPLPPGSLSKFLIPILNLALSLGHPPPLGNRTPEPSLPARSQGGLSPCA